MSCAVGDGTSHKKGFLLNAMEEDCSKPGPEKTQARTSDAAGVTPARTPDRAGIELLSNLSCSKTSEDLGNCIVGSRSVQKGKIMSLTAGMKHEQKNWRCLDNFLFGPLDFLAPLFFLGFFLAPLPFHNRPPSLHGVASSDSL